MTATRASRVKPSEESSAPSKASGDVAGPGQSLRKRRWAPATHPEASDTPDPCDAFDADIACANASSLAEQDVLPASSETARDFKPWVLMVINICCQPIT